MSCETSDELRRLLDERGVKWTSERVSGGVLFTFANDGRTYSVFVRDRAGLEIWSKYLTPEQAIAATLGDTDATRERQGDAGTCRPCPFCGSNAETVHTLNVVPHEPWWIRCPSCGATTPKYSSETDAIAAWNRRAQ